MRLRTHKSDLPKLGALYGCVRGARWQDFTSDHKSECAPLHTHVEDHYIRVAPTVDRKLAAILGLED